MSARRSLNDVLGGDDRPIVTEAVREKASKPTPVIVPINMMVTPYDRQRLLQLKTDKGISLQKLGHKAWNMLLDHYGLSPLEPAPASVREKNK